MTATPEIVALWREMRLDADGKFVPVHRDGRPFSAAEVDKALSATAEDLADVLAALDAEDEALSEQIGDHLAAIAGLEFEHDLRADAQRLAAMCASTGAPTMRAAVATLTGDQHREARDILDRLLRSGFLGRADYDSLGLGD